MALARKNLGAVQDGLGKVVDGAEIEVRNEATGLLPQLYNDPDAASAKGNPFIATLGATDAWFHTAAGEYRVTTRFNGDEHELRYEPVGTAQATDAADLNIETTVTAVGDFTVTDENLVRLDKTVPATTNVILPPSATRPGEDIVIKDVAGNAGSFNFAVKGDGTEDVDGITAGAGGYLGTMNFQTVRIRGRADGTGWDVIHSA
jgi:hypothetical protein